MWLVNEIMRVSRGCGLLQSNGVINQYEEPSISDIIVVQEVGELRRIQALE